MTGAKFTWADVEAHNTEESTWIVMNGKVYDLTKFLDEHPGGREVILEHAGQDSTEAFDEVGHSRDAEKMAEDYVIGELLEEEDSRPKAPTKGETKAGVPAPSSTRNRAVLIGGSIVAATLAIGLGIVAARKLRSH